MSLCRRWVGETEYGLLLELLRSALGARILDVGCGGGFVRGLEMLLSAGLPWGGVLAFAATIPAAGRDR